MKKSYICWTVLIISVLANIYLFTRNTTLNASVQSLSTALDTCESTACDDGGFGEIKAMSPTELISFQQQFIEINPDVEEITGGVISADAIREMLCLENCNALAYSFGRDTIPDKGPDKSGIFIALKGVNVVYDADNNRITDVKGIGSRIYYGGYWCPTHCLSAD